MLFAKSQKHVTASASNIHLTRGAFVPPSPALPQIPIPWIAEGFSRASFHPIASAKPKLPLLGKLAPA